MRELFYALVEIITEFVTGYTNGQIKLWELEEYLYISGIVTDGLNVCCAIFLVAFIMYIVMTIMEHNIIVKGLTEEN